MATGRPRLLPPTPIREERNSFSVERVIRHAKDDRRPSMTGDRNGCKLGRSFVHFSPNLNVVVDADGVDTLRALKFVTHALSRITGTIGNRENLICLSIIRTPTQAPTPNVVAHALIQLHRYRG